MVRLIRAFVSAGKIRFSRQRRLELPETWFEWGLLRRQIEHLVLARPFSWQVGEPTGPYAMGQSAFDRGLDEIGREEGQ